jgi:hypothetical protein
MCVLFLKKKREGRKEREKEGKREGRKGDLENVHDD